MKFLAVLESKKIPAAKTMATKNWKQMDNQFFLENKDINYLNKKEQ